MVVTRTLLLNDVPAITTGVPLTQGSAAAVAGMRMVWVCVVCVAAVVAVAVVVVVGAVLVDVPFVDVPFVAVHCPANLHVAKLVQFPTLAVPAPKLL